MSGYILSVLGVILAGVLIDIIVPAGNINKYIKSIFSIFIIVVLVSPAVKFVGGFKGVDLNTSSLLPDETLLNFIYKSQINNKEIAIENDLSKSGFDNIDIKLQFSTDSNELKINSCIVILKNMTNNSDNQHIDIYENIYEIVNQHTGLDYKEIIYE